MDKLHPVSTNGPVRARPMVIGTKKESVRLFKKACIFLLNGW